MSHEYVATHGKEPNKLCEDLLDALEVSEGAHRKLLRISREKQEALIGLDYSRIEKMVRAEDKLIDRIARVEKRRIQASIDAAHAFGLNPEEVSLLEIAQEAPESYREQLLDKRQKLRNLMTEITNTNETNQQLGEQELRRTEEFFNLMVGANDSEEDTYSRTGERTNSEHTTQSLIDQRV